LIATTHEEDTTMIYTLHELQHTNDHRAGTPYDARSLTVAKMQASRQQMFSGTVLRVDLDGHALAVKSPGQPWRDLEQAPMQPTDD
jgi:hypothetical protein